MGDEAKVVKIKVSADGTKEAAEGLSKVGDQLDRQKTAIKAMDDAMAASGYLARLAQYKAEAAALNAEQDKNVATVKKVTAAVEENSAAFGDHSSKLRSQLGAGAGALSQLAGAFSQVVPSVGAFSGALDVGLKSMGGLLGVLGGGPGILLGGAVAALGLLGSAMSSAKQEADELAKSTEAAGVGVNAITEARNKALERSGAYGAEAATQKQLASGIGEAGEDKFAANLRKATSAYDTEIAVLKQKLADNRAQIAALRADSTASWEVLKHRSDFDIPQIKNVNEALEEQLDMLKERRKVAADYAEQENSNTRDQLELQRQLAKFASESDKKKRQRTIDFNEPVAWVDNTDKWARKRDLNRARGEEARAAIGKIDAIQFANREQEEVERPRAEQKAQFAIELNDKKEQLDRLLQQFKSLEYDKTALVTTNIEEQKRLLETEIGETVSTLHAQDAEEMVAAEQLKRDAMNETRDEFMRLEDEKADKIQATIALEKQSRGQMTQSAMALGTTLAQLTAKQLSEAVKGHKIQAAMIVEGIGDAMVAEGVRVMFQGGAMLLGGNYVGGGGMLALGAAELAAGLALGAAGSAMQPPTPAGGGASEPSAQPERGSQSSNGDNGGHTTIIYVDMPTVVSPTAEDGLRVQMAIDRATLVYGAHV